jgi:hydrogenase 3 maturation protease
MAKGKHGVKKDLKTWLSQAKRVVVAGIGNPIRMDDFVGVKIVQDLRGKVSEKVYLIECETVPESFMQQIIDFDPTHILLIDAAILGGESGSAKLVKPEELMGFSTFSTHMLPVRILCEYVGETTKAEIILLLLEPGQTDFGEGLTAEVEASAGEIVGMLAELLP